MEDLGKPEEGGLNICKIVYWEKGGEAPTLRVGEHVLYAVPFSELRIFSWRLGKNPSIGNNLVIAEIFSFSPDK